MKQKAVFAVSLLLTLCAIVYIGWTHAQAGRYMYPGILGVIPLQSEGFHVDDFEDNNEIELERWFVGSVQSELNTAFAHITETGEMYRDLVFMPFIHGGLWRDEDSIILSESLAWDLFGNTDVIGLSVHLNEQQIYTISGVVKDSIEPRGVLSGFAWVLRPSSAENAVANVLYLRPETYNRLGAHFSIIDLLESTGRHPHNYTIIDISAYIDSIFLRGQILLALTGLLFAIITLNHIRQLAQQIHKKLDWFLLATVVIIGIAVAAFLMQNLHIDLWMPAHAGEGWQAWGQFLFNNGLLMSSPQLPGHLSALYYWNMRANVAFAVGGAGLVQMSIMVLVWQD